MTAPIDQPYNPGPGELPSQAARAALGAHRRPAPVELADEAAAWLKASDVLTSVAAVLNDWRTGFLSTGEALRYLVEAGAQAEEATARHCAWLDERRPA